MPLNRRTVLLLLGAGAFTYGVPRALQWASPLPTPEPLPGLPGFTRLQTGALSRGASALRGIEAEPTPSERAFDAALEAGIRANPLAALHGPAQEGQIPIAVFTDVNCANCRAMAPVFADLAQRADISLRWHELPLLGPSSTLAARAGLAAKAQGGYEALHLRMMAGQFRPSPAYIRQLAEAEGLDGAQLLTDMARPEIDQALAETRALARVLRLPGTPSLVIDRMLVIGALDAALLNRLIARAKRA